MSFSLPQEMRDWIIGRIEDGHYGNISEYLRDLVRRDQRALSDRRLQELTIDGVTDVEVAELARERWNAKRRRLRKRLGLKGCTDHGSRALGPRRPRRRPGGEVSRSRR